MHDLPLGIQKDLATTSGLAGVPSGPPTPAWRTWLQLLRAPNLLTVGGDPLAGYFLACFGALEGKLWLPIAASLCFYGGGLLLNDAVDLREDRAERPERPLPSGLARLGTVWLVMLGLFGLGLALCALSGALTLAVGVGLIGAIASYNLFAKRIPVFGALNMGACRGLSVFLGATAVPHNELTFLLIRNGRLDHLLIAVSLITLYIAAVTHLARYETRLHAPAYAKWLPGVVVAAGAVPFILQISTIQGRLASSFLLLVVVLSSLQTARELSLHPATPIPPQIGTLIRLLLLLQAAFCAPITGLAGAFAAAVLVILWPISRNLSRQFYAS